MPNCQRRLGLKGRGRLLKKELHIPVLLRIHFYSKCSVKKGKCEQNEISTYPGMFPPGPIEVLNIRLKETGGDRSFPVTGDFTL